MNEKELADWIASKQHYGRLGSTVAYGPQCVDASELRELFKGMKLVPADAVVLTREDAELLTKVLGTRAHTPSCISVSRLVEAIEQAKGHGND